MASRSARQFFYSSLRSAVRPAFRAQHAGRRGMSSTAQEAKKGSDLPWIIGSAVVFGPARSLSAHLQFLYLASPSSRKTAPHVAHDKHDKHGHESQSHAPLPMKDDEGTVADVSGSVAKAEAEDVPQSDSAPTGKQGEAKEDKPKEDMSEEKTEDMSEEAKSVPLEKEKRSGEVKDPAGAKSEPGPTNQGVARTASVDHEAPKTIDDKVNKSSSK
ncbi:hypothetical protein MPER_06883 [Moniliophthora perniciosa FA553]|nr:hypothetical protein MPER_06883 [Moniliophthora perniciosa FA553]